MLSLNTNQRSSIELDLQFLSLGSQNSMVVIGLESQFKIKFSFEILTF